jgi:arylsulfatase
MGLVDENYRLSKSSYDEWDNLSDTARADEIRKMEVYAAMIDRMDQNIGRVLKKLRETGKDENTLILFVSDNGASAEVVQLPDDYGEIGTMTRWASLGPDWANVSNTPFRYYKNYSYEGGTNTPFIAYWPGKIEPNSFSEFPGHFIDLMATFVDLTGAEYPQEFNGQQITPMQGQSLLPVFRGKETERKNPIFWEWSDGQAAYHNSWKIVKEGLDNPWELYNLEEDPTETTNLAKKNPGKVEELARLFMDWKEGLPEF